VDENNLQSFENIQSLIAKHNFTILSTKPPDEYRLMFLTNLVTILIKGHSAVDSEHFSPLVEPSS
jgi:hypothetical protein